VLRGAAALLRERSDAISANATIEQGKTRAEMRMEVEMAAAALEWSAEEGRRAYGRVLPAATPGTRVSVVREPVGPVAAMTPWNFPVVGPARKLGPALAAGCTCVLKPAEEAPASALAVAQALFDAGLPDGALAVLCGRPADLSRWLLSAPAIRKLSFTGSVPVGKQLLALAAQTVTRTTMELGGHAPVIVLDDADLDVALAHSVFMKFRNAGQICISPTRFYVHEAVYDRFAAGFAAGAGRIVVGDGLDEATQMGPLAHERRVTAVDALVEDAVDHGAQLLAGGQQLDRPGFFYAPTVLGRVPSDARLMQEEPFGPVAALVPVADLDHAVSEANRLPYGLAAYAFTRDTQRARELGRRLEAGIVGINTYAVADPAAPFGGVKESGFGSEDGIEGVAAHLVTKALYEA
jgi:succinate-semialdehyde dehydrogenase/glutarate-semialdehyde dehydrogenase